MEAHIGRITATHPESGSVDAILPIDGRRLTNVRVLSNSASSRSGIFNIPSPSLGKSKNKDVARIPLGDLEMQGIFLQTDGGFVCLGFFFPHNSQMLFKDANRSINRHPSGVYTTIDANGNTEFYHPSGAYVRIGSSPDHEDLTGKDRDGTWKIGGASPGYITISQAGGKASLTIDPSGKVELNAEGEIKATSKKEITLKAKAINYDMDGTSMRLDSRNAVIDTIDITFTGNARINGDLFVDGDAKVDGTIRSSGDIRGETEV